MPERKKYLAVLDIALLIALAAALLFTYVGAGKRPLLMFSGSGMKVPVSELVKDFTDTSGIPVDAHFEGSSILRQYVEIYGDVDLMLSGDRENIDRLEKKGLVREKAFVAWHVPAILVPSGNIMRIQGLDDLGKKGIRLVMSNPRQASLGRMLQDMLQRHPNGASILRNVVVYGSSSQDDLRLFRDLYKQGKADAVIEWDVMVHAPEGEGLIVVPFEKEFEVKNAIIVALLSTSRDPRKAKRLYDFFTRRSVSVFQKNGYATEEGK